MSEAGAATDFELLRQWQDGDDDAGDVLLGRHFPSVYRFFRSKVPEQAEDLAQRTFLGCVEARDRIEERTTFKGYLFGVARRRLADHFRLHQRKYSRTRLGDVSIAALTGESPSKAAVFREEQRLLLAAMRQIPVDFQIALELFYWEEMTIPEIASVLEIAEGTVKSRLSRAKDRVRTAIESLDAPDAVREATVTNIQEWARQLRATLDKGEEA